MRNTNGCSGQLHLTVRRLIATLVAVACCALPAVADETSKPTQMEALLTAAMRNSPAYTVTLRYADGSPLAIFRDFNRDGEPDVALLSVVSDPRVEPSADELSRIGRLYDQPVVDPTFILEIYFAGQDAIVTAEIGRRRIWTLFETFDFCSDGSIPGIRVAFRDRSGESSEIVAIRGANISRFSLQNNRNEHGYLLDGDRDGTLDLVTARRVPEAGLGFETFLELHRLGPNGFRRSASIPLVRTLNLFLGATAHEIENESWPEVAARIGFVATTEDAAGTGHAGRTPDGIATALSAVFTPVPDEEEESAPAFDFPSSGIDVTHVVFRPIADNPFAPPFLGMRFRTVFRVERGDAPPAVFAATVGLSNEPFVGRVVAFLTEDEARQ